MKLFRRAAHYSPIIARICAVVLLIGACAFAQSQPKPIPQSQDHSPEDQQIGEHLRAIESELRAIREQEAGIEASHANQKPDYGPAIWSNWFIFAAAAAAFIAAIKTLREIGEQVKESRRTADASEHMILLANQPKLIVRTIMLLEANFEGFPRRMAQVIFANVGLSDAHKVSLNARWFKWKQLPRRNPVHTSMRVIASQVSDRIPGGLWQVVNFGETVGISAEDSEDISGDDFIAGYVQYEDRIGTHHSTIFCWRLNEGSGKFVEINVPDFNYIQ